MCSDKKTIEETQGYIEKCVPIIKKLEAVIRERKRI
jgi:type IV secretory pathway protease TraF